MDASLPIWPQHEVFYIESMLFHTRQACASMDYIADLIERIDRHQAEGSAPAFDCSVALDHVQSVVLCAAAVSRYFWPVRKAHAPRGAYLRRVLKVEDNSPLRIAVLGMPLSTLMSASTTTSPAALLASSCRSGSVRRTAVTRRRTTSEPISSIPASSGFLATSSRFRPCQTS